MPSPSSVRNPSAEHRAAAFRPEAIHLPGTFGPQAEADRAIAVHMERLLAPGVSGDPMRLIEEANQDVMHVASLIRTTYPRTATIMEAAVARRRALLPPEAFASAGRPAAE